MKKGNRQGIRRRVKKGRARTVVKVFALLLICCFMPFLLKTAAASAPAARILLTVEDASILQDEELPKYTVKVSMEGDGDGILDTQGEYTVEDLVRDLKDGKGYTLACEADASQEGEWPIEIVLDQEITDKMDKEWVGLVEIETTGGKLQVKNKVGEWDGDKFRRYDGTYVTNDFVVSMGDTYYFGEDGTKLTSWQTIGEKLYEFDENGVMKTGWSKKEEDTYYLGKDGAAVIGWQELDGATYYFHQDGKMAVGKTYLGVTLCEFGEDGKLISKKDTGIDPDKPMIALTFDDGPGKRTGELLDQLEKYGARATFFMLGQKVSSYKEEVKRMKAIGCELGNHSYDHADLSKVSEEKVKKEIEDTNSRIRDIVGEGATVMRPPYGAISKTLKENVGMPMILWNIDTLDWKTRNAKKTIDSVMDNVKDGDVILIHDIHTESVDAAIALIPKLLDEGYQLVTVSELAAAKGVELEDGGKYTDF